ncbi:MAG TPA: hypothetical protein VN673_12475, partial [Clostridia bacterium]|nr:hypothetical protein [Clostridia bacterium]
MESTPELASEDPLGLDRADREIRIEKLKQEIETIAGEPVISGASPDCPPELQEAFLENILALETHGFERPFDVLVSSGFSLPP